MIAGLSEIHARTIERARDQGPFVGWEDFIGRTRLSRAVIVRLAGADAFSSLKMDRRGALWRALAEEKKARAMPLFDQSPEDDEAAPVLEPLGLQDEIVADYRTAGLSLRAHPLEIHRARLDELGIVSAEDLAEHPADRAVRVAGIVLVRQRPARPRASRSSRSKTRPAR